MNECTAEIPAEEKKKREVKTGICYKCGSTEHRLQQCTVKGDSFAYATCFICGKQGHWSRLCPDNPNGLYPNGGCCNECGSIQHFKRDCPTLLKKQGEFAIDDILYDLILSYLGIDDQQLPRLTANTNNIDDHIESAVQEKSPLKTKKSIKRLKVVKF
jgi:zinc finger CCHC domain-containing protein 9